MSTEDKLPTPPALFRHYKGEIYRMITKGEHADTNHPMIAYQSTDPAKPKIWFHRVEDFFQLVPWEGQMHQRFSPYAGKFPNCS